MDSGAPVDAETAWRLLIDPAFAWGVGCHAALAEFHRPAEEALAIEDAPNLTLATRRGAIRIDLSAAPKLLAYRRTQSHGSGWHNGLVFLLPAKGRRLPPARIRELGPDDKAIWPGDSGELLFDLGLGVANMTGCLRVRDEALIWALRDAGSRPLSEAGPGLMARLIEIGPDRVFFSDVARIEVKQPIPPPGGASPEGPHPHLFPERLASAKTHEHRLPVPDGMIPVLECYPPTSDPAAFEPYLTAFGSARSSPVSA